MKRAFKAAFISALLITTVAATLQINIGKANPYQYMGEVPPDANTKPPIISIQSPDSEVYYTNNVSLTFNVSIGKSTTATFPYIFAVYYRGDWQQKNTSVYQSDASHGPLTFAEFSCNLYIPNGNHSILINATEIGKYAYSRNLTYYRFYINGSSTIRIAIGNTPSVSVLSPENKRYDTPDIPLGFIINKPFSQITYSLDKLANVTTAGNMTLTGLSNGEHNVTIFAEDSVGNVGVSEMVTFTVDMPEPFPTTLVAASLIAVFSVGIGLLVYFKKRKR